MSNKKCPECKTEMKLIKEQSSIAWVCPRCGYGEATTITEPIYDDEKIYSIVLCNNNCDINVIKALSKFTGFNFIKTKKLIKNPSLIYSGKAYDLLEKKKELDKYNINYRIEPEFPYSKEN